MIITVRVFLLRSLGSLAAQLMQSGRLRRSGRDKARDGQTDGHSSWGGVQEKLFSGLWNTVAGAAERWEDCDGRRGP